jgi:putative ABC transport system substrate-binding protein
MNNRRKLVIALGLSPLAAHVASFAQQQTGRIFRIGFLSAAPRPPDGLTPMALRQALARLGYVDAKNVVYEGRWAEGRFARLPELAADLVRLRVDAIIVSGDQASVDAKRATAAIPIILAGASDPVGTGMIVSLARPGGNITGTSAQATDLSAKRLEILKEAVPKAVRVAVLWNLDNAAMTRRYQRLEDAARILRLTIQPLGVREIEDFDAVLSTMTREHPDALVMVSDPFTTSNSKRVIEFNATHRIPAIYERDSLVQEGGLMSYGPSSDEIFRRVAVYVDKILKGAIPGELSVEQMDRTYLHINLKTAKALGLSIPQSLLLRADEVIQ